MSDTHTYYVVGWMQWLTAMRTIAEQRLCNQCLEGNVINDGYAKFIQPVSLPP